MQHSTILLVEDNDTLGYILKEYLEMKGLEVDWVKNGIAGLNAFREKAYHLCVLDVMMPGMDGLEVLTELRRDSAVPVVMQLN